MSSKRQRIASAAQPPAPAADQYRALLPPDEFEKMVEVLKHPIYPGVRVNTLKISPADAIHRWPARYGWEVQTAPFCPSGWRVLLAATRPSHTPEFKLGYYYIQDVASMLPVELFDFSGLEHPLILELAAAPGGKTTHLASRSGDLGLLLANDSSHGRIPALHSALQDWGAMNSLVTNLPGEKYGGWYPNSFDLVLLDAPCSMENLKPAVGSPRRAISNREREGLAQRQFRLLSSAIQAVRPGGQVVYSTCTLAPEENEGVLEAAMRRFGGLIEIDEVNARLPSSAPGLAYYGEEDFNPQVTHGLRLWPHLFDTSGFFAARLTKTGPSGAAPEAPPRVPFEKHHFTRLSRSGQAELFKRLAERYGVNLAPVFANQALSLWKREDTYFALPDRYLEQFSGLPVDTPGFWVGEDTLDGFIPSHELSARFGQDFTRGVYRVSLDDAARWLRGEDLPPAPADALPVGTVAVVVDEWDRLLGRGKAQRERLKNMLPRRLL